MKKIMRYVLGMIVITISLPVLLVGVVGEFLSAVADCYVDALEAAKKRSERIYGKG